MLTVQPNEETNMSNAGIKLPPEILTTSEVRSLLGSCGSSWSEQRNRTLLIVLYRGGLRTSEALDLCPKDVDLDGGRLHVLHGKGDKSRTVGIDPWAVGELRAWLVTRAEKVPNGGPVFCSLQGTRMLPVYVRATVKRLARMCDIEKRVHPHAFRHTMACELRREGVDIGVISRQLGHSSIATTAQYLAHICPQEVVDTMQKREWKP